MNLSPRVYIYAVDNHNTHHFLVTELDEKAAKDYCKKHAKAFKGHYDRYVYGCMNKELDEWEVYREDI